MATKAVPIEGQHAHDGCRYYAALFEVEDAGTFWFCNKCGQGGEAFPAPTVRDSMPYRNLDRDAANTAHNGGSGPS